MANHQDLTGQRFGKLVVEQDAGRYKTGEIQWLCRCDCGNTRYAKTYYLKRGVTCCIKCNFTDYTGQKIGKLTVLERSEDKKVGVLQQKRIMWKCQCECGDVVYRDSGKLKRGNCCCKNCKAKFDHINNGTGYEDITGIYWSSIRGQAAKRNIEFLIDIEYAWKIFQNQDKKCALSGINIGFALTKKRYLKGETTASLDRIDSSLGYVKGNVQWVHKWINKMKSNHPEKVFINFCEKVSEWQKCVQQ